MRLAFLLYKYFPYGGMQRDFRRFVEECQQRGHTIRVYFIRWQGEPLSGVDARQVPAKGLSNYHRNERYLHWVQADLARDPVDGVVGFNKMPGLDVYYAADSCYLDKALNERGWLYRLTPRFRHFAAYERAVFAADAATEILLISDTEKAKFLRHYHTPEARLHMLPPGISADRRAGPDAAQRRRAKRAELGLAEGEQMLLFVGSGFIKKGLGRAIRALDALRRRGLPAQLYIVGQDKEAGFRRQVAKLGVGGQVHFLGGRDDVPDLLLAADALVHPALDEAAGIVLLEALVAGLPVVVTDVCGYAHHIAAANAGRVLPSPFVQGALERALEEVLAAEENQRCRAAALDYAGREDLYSMHRTGAELIEQLLPAKTGDSGG
ncbi:glycosyltransferase family 4 protein [Parahaliea aestuarii]|uniref:Glycosyltransferase family 4 protein n=1 Tax=Parahaliea aestuarii TaxID=1852021 RepID=A0A5C8ZYD9_9GAMM|nr:glycosyltransferase family 4 protein [Parahaliea aestuarii]TXS92271.1 glycosyltransferase family 4 protein [Parahaliea aestuarii]